MPEFESIRTTADAIGRVMCIKTSKEIGLLYRWNTGETQAALYDCDLDVLPTLDVEETVPDLGTKRF